MDKPIFDLQGTKIRIIIIHSKSEIIKIGWRIEITKMEGPPGCVESVGSNPSGALTKTYLELRDIPVEEFLEMLRCEQRNKFAELPSELLRECSR